MATGLQLRVRTSYLRIKALRWLGIQGSNLKPSGSEPDALPIALIPNEIVFGKHK